MGASNFYNVNAKHIYAVLMDYEDEAIDLEGNPTGEKETRVCEDFDVHDLKDDLVELATTLAKEKGYQFRSGGTVVNDARSYEGTAICRLSDSNSFGDMGIHIEVTMILRSAYHEGGNLDWEISYSVDNNEREDLEDLGNDFRYYSAMNKGMAVIQSKNAYKWGIKATEKLTNDVERLFAKISTPYNVFARFSNGETMYSKVEK